MDNAQKLETAKRRLVVRLLTLVVVGVLATYFQIGFEEDGQIWMFFAEIATYTALLIVYLRDQTGRLKSGPDTGKVSATELFEDDPGARTYIAIYAVILMLFTVAYAFLGNEITTGPWNIFIAVCPILVIVFLRQYRLERRRAGVE